MSTPAEWADHVLVNGWLRQDGFGWMNAAHVARLHLKQFGRDWVVVAALAASGGFYDVSVAGAWSSLDDAVALLEELIRRITPVTPL